MQHSILTDTLCLIPLSQSIRVILEPGSIPLGYICAAACMQTQALLPAAPRYTCKAFPDVMQTCLSSVLPIFARWCTVQQAVQLVLLYADQSLCVPSQLQEQGTDLVYLYVDCISSWRVPVLLEDETVHLLHASATLLVIPGATLHTLCQKLILLKLSSSRKQHQHFINQINWNCFWFQVFFLTWFPAKIRI